MEARSIAKTIELIHFIPTIPNSSVLFLVLSKSAWSGTEGEGDTGGKREQTHVLPHEVGSLRVLVLPPH